MILSVNIYCAQIAEILSKGKVIMVDVTSVTSVEEFIAAIKKLDGEFAYYRGEHCTFAKPLCSSALRNHKNNTDIARICMDLYRHVFSSLTVNESEHMLAFAQHHGLQTNLLDVSTNPLIALFFACKDCADKNGIVYCFKEITADISAVVDGAAVFNVLECCRYPDDNIKDTYLQECLRNRMKWFVNENNIGKWDPFEYWKEVINFQGELNEMPRTIYRPLLSFSRPVAQQGCFIYQWFFQERENSVVKNTYFKEISEDEKILVSARNKQGILNTLDTFGINEATVLGDYDSIVKYIKQKNRSTLL